MDEHDTVFTQLYREYIRKGGFRQPCISEDIERRARQTRPRQPTICPHGKSLLTCSDCYFGRESQ